MTVSRRHLVITSAVLGLLILLLLWGSSGTSSRGVQFLDVEIRASAGNIVQVYWANDFDFVDENSIRLPLRPPLGDFQRLRFPLPLKGVRWLRLDPTDVGGEVSIRQMQLLDAKGKATAILSPESLHPFQQIASMTRDGDVMRVTTMPGATHAQLVASLSFLDRSLVNRLSLVTPASLALVTAAILTLLIACVIVVGRAALTPEPGDSVPLPRWQLLLWMGSLFLIVFSAKLLFMRENPVTAPFWDQWDIEASRLYVPYHEGGLLWRSMFSLANEHRVFFTRLLALDLLVLNGKWDPRLQQVVQAGMHAFTAVILITVLWLANKRRRLDLLVFIGALSFAPPFAWENTLLAIQSAADFLLLFSILSLWLVTSHQPRTGPWFLGWACATCGLFTFASGILVPAVAMSVLVLKWASDRDGWRDLAANGAVAGLLLALGAALASPPIAGHAFLRAKTLADFLTAAGHNLSWPFVAQVRLSLLMWVPVAVLLAGALWRRGRTTELERLASGLAIWVVLNAGLLAYGRGAGGAIPATRYMDYLSLGFVANTLALVALLDRTRHGTTVRRVGLVVLASWLVWVSVGVDSLVGKSMNDMTVWRPWFANHATHVRRLIVSGDPAPFMVQTPLQELPYPDPGRLTTLLADAYTRDILSLGVREPAEIGRISGLSEWLIRNSREMLFLSLALAVLAVRGHGEPGVNLPRQAHRT